nr:hypothetical protein [Tanacetum cinerariifolium]
MLAPGNYVQWKSRIKRYIDTKPNHELIHYCLTNPPYKLGIDNDIYSTVDACPNACDMWRAIESRANQDNSPRINRGTGYDNQRLGNIVGARETVSTTVVRKSGIQCYNYKEFGHVASECQKPKKVKDASYHKEKMLLYAADNSGPIFDTEPVQQIDQNDGTDDLDNERELLASLIEKLKCEIDDKMKKKLSAHQETISILTQQKEAQIKLYKSREDKEL